MQWDMSDDFGTQTNAPAGEREIMPAGVHRMVIKHAEEGPNEYKRSDENPEGLCLKLRLSDAEGRFKFVFDDLPQQKSLAWRARQLAAAVGINPIGETLTLDPGELDGQVVDVEISHYTSRAGKVSAVVKRYIERRDAPAKPAAKARTTAARVTASLDDDVVPF